MVHLHWTCAEIADIIVAEYLSGYIVGWVFFDDDEDTYWMLDPMYDDLGFRDFLNQLRIVKLVAIPVETSSNLL